MFLVTGGAGFIGSHLVDCLLKMGAGRIVVIDNLSTGNVDNISKDSRVEVLNERAENSKPEGKFDFILHLASMADPTAFIEHPIEIMDANILGTRNMLELAEKTGAKFLFASTSEVYGNPPAEALPLKEEYNGNVSVLGPRACYDESKRVGEVLVRAFIQNRKVDGRIVRIFNTYGPKMKRYGQYGRVVPNFVCQALVGEPLTVYGTGKQTRSFCYVTDTVAGMLLLLFREGTKGMIVNVGNDNEMSVLELANIVTELTGTESNIVFKELPKDDPLRRKPDLTKAKTLGYSPKVKLEDGLRETIKFYKGILGK
ncbi:MAG: NAD-dependent epimerase/dehydratase family protein [Candidatus Aenigmarchaeota archaeon]|nr:NAD-dependent epimerase/dehydratase family protein [Candidatus Aenigmarchaeota archaeon]